MATVYGSKVNSVWRAYMTYTMTTTPTQVIVSITSGLNIPNDGYKSGRSFTCAISGTGQTTVSGSISSASRVGVLTKAIKSATYTFNRASTAQTIAIKTVLKGGGESTTSSCSVSINVPALAPATITFNANGGSGTVPSAINTYVGVANTIPSNSLTRTGYTFDGWNTASDGSGTAYATGSTITPTGNVTLYAQWETTYVKPEIQNLLAFRTANDSGGASPTVTSTGTTGFCKFQLVGGANYTFTSATVRFGTATAKSMTKSGTTLYGYSDVGAVAETSAYTVTVTVAVTGTDGISRTYTDSTYISKAVPIFDATPNTVAFGGTAKDTTDGEKRFDCYMDAYFSDGVTVGGHDSPIGTKLESSKTNIAVAAGVDTHHDGASLTLGKGVWVAIGRWSFNTRASGTTSANRQTSIAVNGTIWMSQRVNTYGGNFGMLQCVAILNLTEESNIVTCKGSCSAATNGTNYDNSLLIAVRIA